MKAETQKLLIDGLAEADRKTARAVKVWGTESQTRMALEEMAELTQALCRYQRGRIGIEEVREEIVDVLVVMTSLMHVFGKDETVGLLQKKLAKFEGHLQREGNRE